MAKWAVETDLLIHTTVRVVVEADNQDDAIDAAADVLPSNFNGRSHLFKADVALQPPEGTDIRVVKVHHFQQASGREKAKKIR